MKPPKPPTDTSKPERVRGVRSPADRQWVDVDDAAIFALGLQRGDKVMISTRDGDEIAGVVDLRGRELAVFAETAIEVSTVWIRRRQAAPSPDGATQSVTAVEDAWRRTIARLRAMPAHQALRLVKVIRADLEAVFSSQTGGKP